jgi:lipopolysaccharide biosynthesis glycosyltransferase
LDTSLLEKLKENYINFNLSYRTVDTSFDESFEIRGITPATYYRLMIPEFIPEYDKIIYSDVDVIFREDLSLWYEQTSFENEYVAGVNSLSHLKSSTKQYYLNEMGLDPSQIIYAGNIILNSKKIREDGLILKFKAHAYKKYRYQDLDILNLVCKDRIKFMSPGFCLTTDITEYASDGSNRLLSLWNESEISHALERGIVHYNGQKPWIGGCINFDIWWEYYRKSPYFDQCEYYTFFDNMLNYLDSLSLLKRIKILLRYFIFGKYVRSKVNYK